MATVCVNLADPADLETVSAVAERMARSLRATPGVIEEIGTAAMELGWVLLSEGSGRIELWIAGRDVHLRGSDEGERCTERSGAWPRWRASELGGSLHGSRPRPEGLAAVSMLMDQVALSSTAGGGLSVHAVRRELGRRRGDAQSRLELRRRLDHLASLRSTPVDSHTPTR